LLKAGVREHDVLRQLREATHQLPMARMQICPEQGQFMRLLIELMGARKTLEIGTFTGYSALCVALSLPSDGQIIACDVSTEWTDMAKRYWELAKVSQKIDLRIAPALETLDNLLQQGQTGTFDFVFIDADKQNYPRYYEKSLALLRVGGLVAIDNVLWDGKVANPNCDDAQTSSIRQLNDVVMADERVTVSMIPVGDGLTLARKR
jgi:caffeoyl-CoA O-methyltransferase